MNRWKQSTDQGQRMKIGDCSVGDVISSEGTHYRLTMRVRGGWGCRPLLDDEWCEHVWFKDEDVIDELIKEQPKRNSKARREPKADASDPLLGFGWKGTVR